MIDSTILKLMTRRVPNYHLVREAFLRGSLSVCNCARCRHSDLKQVKNSMHLVCGRVLEYLREAGAADGIAIVAENGTCDAAQFVSEDYTNFRLEQDGQPMPTGNQPEGVLRPLTKPAGDASAGEEATDA